MQTSYQLMLRHRKPVIGSQVMYCPHCKRPLSYSDKMGQFCRSCQAATKMMMQQYIKTVEEGR